MSNNIDPKKEVTMTLEEAKSAFPLNPHWVDMSNNSDFPLSPLCICFDPDKVKEYTSIPIGKHILDGIDASGNTLRIILCDRCLDYNIQHQKKQQALKKIEEKIELKEIETKA